MSPTQPEKPVAAAGVLADDHSEVDMLIDNLLAALAEADRTKAYECLDLLWARLAVHIRAEHLCLFPAILQAHFTVSSDGPTQQQAQTVVDQLRLDHDFFMHQLGTAVNHMREHRGSNDADAITKLLRNVEQCVVQVRNRLEQHNHREEDQIYKWADVLLDEGTRAALAARIKHELDNLPARFRG